MKKDWLHLSKVNEINPQNYNSYNALKCTEDMGNRAADDIDPNRDVLDEEHDLDDGRNDDKSISKSDYIYNLRNLCIPVV